MVNIGLSCNSRFCVSCGNRYREQRALSISKKVISKPHRQFVFSIAKQLRKYFAETLDRDALLDILFSSVEFAFESLIQGDNIHGNIVKAYAQHVDPHRRLLSDPHNFYDVEQYSIYFPACP